MCHTNDIHCKYVYVHVFSCWLSIDKGVIWAFLGPMLAIVIVRINRIIVRYLSCLSGFTSFKSLLRSSKGDQFDILYWLLSELNSVPSENISTFFSEI